MADNKKVNPYTSEKLTGLRIYKPASVAAGWQGVKSSILHLQKELGVASSIPLMRQINQMDGYDCPGCAWPDPDGHRSKLGEFCENGAKAIAEEATKKQVDAAFFKKHSVADLSNQSDYWIGKQGRLTEPMVLFENQEHYQPISWEAAYNLIAEELNALPDPNQAIFYTSGRTSNEAAFLYQLFIRQFGTNNLPDCSNMCHESSGMALSETVGIGKGSVKLEDFYQTELILVIGQNPGTNHPRMLSALQKAKENGAQIITINPLPETGLVSFRNPQQISHMLGGKTILTDLFLQVKVNEDVALLKAIMIKLFEFEASGEQVLDDDFIEARTTGFNDFRDELKQFEFEELCAKSGINEAEVYEAARLIASKNKIIACWAMGLTQHKNAVDNIREVVNLLLLKGSIGKPGAGTCPVRGHSNVQGDRTMGIWEKPNSTFLDKLERQFNFTAPRDNGFNTVEAIEAMHSESAKVFFAMGGNFLSATPDTEFTAEALSKCSLTVQVSTKLNRSHLVTGKRAIILPCLGRTEEDLLSGKPQFVTVENSMGVVHQSIGRKQPASEKLKSEPTIVCELAEKVLAGKTKTEWSVLQKDYDIVRNNIEAVIPGFHDYNKRVRQNGGFYLPNCAREGTFEPTNKKASFTVNKISEIELKPGELLMMTVRSHDQFNTTIYGLDDRYRGVFNERRVVFVNAEDMKERGINQKGLVNLQSSYNGKTRFAKRFKVVPFCIPKGCIATYFPEANTLVPIELVAEKSQTPVSKSVIVTMHLTNR